MTSLYTGQTRLQTLLEQEVDYFRSLVQYSKKFVEEIETLSLNLVGEMINFRQEWIDKIQNLEDERKELNSNETNIETENYLKEISTMAKSLVEIDREIYRNLNSRKMNYVREMSKTATGKRYNAKQSQLSQNSNILDVRQE